MLHVPDVKATLDWYESLGFTVNATHAEDGCDLDWASLSFGNSEIMLSAGGKPSTAPRRDVDLYIHTDQLDELHRRIAPLAEVVEDLHTTFYGMREFIIRDPSDFWLTFGSPAPANG